MAITNAVGRLVVLTGASRGLGIAIAERLLREGYRVVGIARTNTNESSLLKERYSESFFIENFDLSETKEIRGLIHDINQRHGSIFGLVNNAAVGYDGVLATMHESQIADAINVNVTAPILLAKYCARSMLIKKQGRIVNISSIIAKTGFSGLSVYGATKASLTGFTKSLARELGKANITVNTVLPGYMATDMTKSLQGEKLNSIVRRSPLGQLATVEDVAGAVSYLLSDDASRLTGTDITVDAGSTA